MTIYFQGEKGDQGLKGSRGKDYVLTSLDVGRLKGMQGEKGDRGPVGPKGSQGSRGEKGDIGFKGKRIIGTVHCLFESSVLFFEEHHFQYIYTERFRVERFHLERNRSTYLV